MRGPNRARRGHALRELNVLRDGAVLFHKDRIVSAGSTVAVTLLLRRRHIPPSQLWELDCRGRLVSPGLVDSHTHLVFAAPRLEEFERRIAGWSAEATAAAGGGILESVRHLRAASDMLLLRSARARLRIMRAQGVTTVEIKSGYGLSLAEEVRMLRLAALAVRAEGLDGALTFLGAHALPPEYAGRPDDYLHLVSQRMLPALRIKKPSFAVRSIPSTLAEIRHTPPAVEFVDVFCDPLAFSRDQSHLLLQAARRRGFKLKLHADQTAASDGAWLAVQLRAVSADHLDYTPPDARRRLARSPTLATLLPGVSLYLNHPYPPARDWIADGAAFNLATDCNPGTSPLLSLPMVMSLACTQMKLSAAEAWYAVTINAAAALGRESICGSLMPGKRADLAIFAVDDYRAVPYFLGAPLCAGVFASGRWHPAMK